MKMIGRLMLALGLMAMMASPVVAAGCTTQSYMVNGRMVLCTVCPGMVLCN